MKNTIIGAIAVTIIYVIGYYNLGDGMPIGEFILKATMFGILTACGIFVIALMIGLFSVIGDCIKRGWNRIVNRFK